MMRIYWNCTQWIEMHSQSQAELVDPKFREKAMLHAADILWVLFCGSQRYHIFIPGRISYVCRFLSMDLKLCLFAHLHFRKIFVQRMVTYGNISQNGESAGHVPWWFWWSFTMNTWQVTLAMGPASGTCVCDGNAFILRLGRLGAPGDLPVGWGNDPLFGCVSAKSYQINVSTIPLNPNRYVSAIIWRLNRNWSVLDLGQQTRSLCRDHCGEFVYPGLDMLFGQWWSRPQMTQ